MSIFSSLAICIPTRNRFDFAKNSINSIISQCQNNDDVIIVVSDNSTDKKESKKLFEFCVNEKHNYSNLHYLRPKKSLTMTENWNYIIDWSLKNTDASHFSILTDRMRFKKNALVELEELMKEFPDIIISYNHDRMDDLTIPIVYEYHECSGRLVEIDSEYFLKLTAELILHAAYPRMLNSVCPRSTLDNFKKIFKNIFSSASPDFNFAFRYLATYEKFFYYDKTLIYHYGLSRSNGMGLSIGVMSKDNIDFLSSTSPTSLSPAPEILSVGNAILHEYYVAWAETKNKKFSEINKEKYYDYLADEISKFQDDDFRTKSYNILESKYGYRKKKNKLVNNLINTIKKIVSNPFYSLVIIVIKYILKRNVKKFRNLDDAFLYIDNYPYLYTSNYFKIKTLLAEKGKIIV